MIKAILIKPLDGDPEGTVREFDQPDFDRLVAFGAVRQADDDVLRSDGPTVDEFVAAGYRADNYPPQGYSSRSSDDEIAAAIASQAAISSTTTDVGASGDASAGEASTDSVSEAGGEKAAPDVEDKAAPPVSNKAARKPSNKAD